MLLHGLALAEAGRRVILVDAADRIGGSWKTRELFGYRNVEVGVHLIENRPHSNSAFRKALGAGGMGAASGDFGLINGRRLPMRAARILLYGLVAAKSALKGRREKTLHSLRNLALATRFAHLQLTYPAGGAAGAFATLATRLRAAGADIRLGCQIDRIEVVPGGVVAHAGYGRLEARALVMSSRAHAPISGLEPLWEDCQRVTTYSYVLRIAGAPPNFSGYVEVIGDRLLKRVRNVGGFARPAVPEGEALLTVQLRGAPADERSAGRSILTRLGDLGLIEPGAVLLDIAADFVELRTLPAASLARIEATHPGRVTVLRTVDLGDQAYDLVAPERAERGLAAPGSGTAVPASASGALRRWRR
jgi:hypothetical protein